MHSNTKYTLLVVSVNYKIFKKVEFPGIPEVILGLRAITKNFWTDFPAPRFKACYHGTYPQKPQSTGSKISFTNIFIYSKCWCQVDFLSCHRNVILFKFVIHKSEIQKAAFDPAVQSSRLPLVAACVTTPTGYSPVQLHGKQEFLIRQQKFTGTCVIHRSHRSADC